MSRILMLLLLIFTGFSQVNSSYADFCKTQIFPVLALNPINNSDYQFESAVYPNVMNLFVFTDSNKVITSIIWNIKKEWLINSEGKLNPYFVPLYPLFVEDCGPEKDEYYYNRIVNILDSLITNNLLPYVIFGSESFLAIFQEANSISLQIFTSYKRLPQNTIVSNKDFYKFDSIIGAELIKVHNNSRIWKKDSIVIIEQHKKFNKLLPMIKYYLQLAGKYRETNLVVFNPPKNPYNRLYQIPGGYAFITIRENDVINIEFKNYYDINSIIKILFN